MVKKIIVTSVSRLTSALLAAMLLLVSGAAIFGLQTQVTAASDLSRSFYSSERIEPGAVVSLQKDKAGYVQGANIDNAEQLVGVVTALDSSLVAVNSSETKIQVAVNGQVTAIVSDLNGAINAGDMIAATPFTGVGAKAKPGDRTVGIAQASFSSDSASTKKVTVTDLKGQTKEINVGNVPIVISVGYMASGSSVYGASKGLQGFATNIAGEPVSILRIAICFVIGLAAIISLVVIVYSSIRNSISAVARNPLAKPAIFDSLAQVMVMIAFIAVVSIVMMYAVLRI